MLLNICLMLWKPQKQNDIKPEVFLGLIMTESMWNHKVVSYAGACGLTQVLPKYSKKYGGKDRNLTCDELKDPVTSIQTGGRILNYWLTKYSKKITKLHSVDIMLAFDVRATIQTSKA